MTVRRTAGRREARFDVFVRVWDPICNRFGRAETLANVAPLTECEADEMAALLALCVDDYRGQGMTIHGVRKVGKI